MSLKRLAEHLAAKADRKAKKKHKYGANREKGQSGSWDSQLEKAVYQILLLREKSGEIQNIKRQVTVDLTPEPHRIRLRIDFTYEHVESGETWAVEAKGFQPAENVLKLKLYRWRGPWKMELWKGTASNPKLAEIIVPERPGT